jgi:hypothetical protein
MANKQRSSPNALINSDSLLILRSLESKLEAQLTRTVKNKIAGSEKEKENIITASFQEETDPFGVALPLPTR